jgi:short-subunit dehydrogenase
LRIARAKRFAMDHKVSRLDGERILIFGASAGLGAAVSLRLAELAGAAEASSTPYADLHQALLIARKATQLANIQTQMAARCPGAQVSISALDVAHPLDQDRALLEVVRFQPTRIFYFIGGGPHGGFASKAWKDHLWAFEVSFVFAARLIHFVLQRANDLKQLKQLILTGSQIAEASADPGAASYAAAKHALLGLISSLHEEKPSLDLRLFSPGYMDTGLLPGNAWPRQQGLAEDPALVGERFLTWAARPEGPWHLTSR